jgi:hypothetical protein
LTVFQRRNAVLDGVGRVDRFGQHRSVDVNDDLIAIARRTRVEPSRERRFGQQDQGVGAAMSRCKLVRRRIEARRVCVSWILTQLRILGPITRIRSMFLVNRLVGRVERPLHDGSCDRIEPGSQNEHPVLVVRDLDVAAIEHP